MANLLPTQESQEFMESMYNDLREANKEVKAVNDLSNAVEQYEKVFGVRLKLKIDRDETCS